VKIYFNIFSDRPGLTFFIFMSLFLVSKYPIFGRIVDTLRVIRFF
jgi:hypothetical protein